MGTKSAVYLDHNATTTVRAVAVDAVAHALRLGGNASSVHGFGRAARKLVEDSRDAVADLVAAAPAGVVFTSGGSEANNLALRRTGRARVLASAVEHASVLKAAAGIEAIPADGNGVVDVAALDAMLAKDDRPALVSVMLANNETGVVQPVAEVAAVAKRRGALVHCDAVQAAGKMAVTLRALGVDMISLSAHKIGGPAGVGALVLAGDVPLAAMIRGGGQERGRRAGTENVPGIAGFGAAARAAAVGIADFQRLGRWRDQIEARLRELAGARVFGAGAPRLANTSCLSMPGVRAENQIIALDLAGVAVSAGAACSSGKIEPSHVLAAMGVGPDEAATAIRVSLGWNSTENDVARFLEAWAGIFAARQSRAVAAA
jgi:cysteine desulfurase